MEHTSASGWVFAASTDYAFEPDVSLQRFLEVALVSGRDTVAYCAPCSASLPSAAELDIEGSGAHARVMRAALPATATTAATTVALLGLQPSALPGLRQFAAEDALAGPWQSLERFVVHLAEARPLTGVPFPTVFSVRTLREALFADSFFAHWGNRVAEHARAAKVRGISPPVYAVDEEVTTAGRAPSELSILSELRAFTFELGDALVQRSKLAGADVKLPKRFTQVSGGEWLQGLRVKGTASCSHRVQSSTPPASQALSPQPFRATLGAMPRGGRTTRATQPPHLRTAPRIPTPPTCRSRGTA